MLIFFVIRLIVNGVALWVTAWLVKGIDIKGLSSLILAVILLGILNAIIKPVLIFLTLPINILTMGIFTFFINAFLLIAVSKLVTGFEIADFWSALVGAIVLSIINFIISFFIVRY
ncbi:MAG: phage holin family protein [Deltaproteobacteria bacterium]|nr:phage holin family protein [Deltaproteobacteria bacterium]RLA91199.1 MAG: phage holin family protein [Deltaproteobacteria bacterium]